MEKIAMIKFREAVANEMLFFITNENPPFLAEDLCEEFENRIGSKLSDVVGDEGRQFLFTSPVLSITSPCVLPYQAELMYTSKDSTPYRHTSDDHYREMLLLEAWKLIETSGWVNACCENSNNSALHFLVGMPGVTTSHLVRLLLQAGADPLQTNEKGQNILHVIAGRMRAKKNGNGDFEFGNEIPPNRQTLPLDAGHRKLILNVLDGELSSAELTALATGQDENGDTAMHKWALSTSIGTTQSNWETTYLEKEKEIASLLLCFGAKIRLPNNIGGIPLHYAFNVYVFQYLLELCDTGLCHIRNNLDETPLMFMIKNIIRQELSQTIDILLEYPELTKDAEFLEWESPIPLTVNKLTDVLKLVEDIDEVKITSGIPDLFGNFISDIVLVSIKISSYDFFNHPRFKNLNDGQKFLKSVTVLTLRHDLAILLEKIMSIADIMKWKQPEKRNSFHVLLNRGPLIPFLNWNSAGTAILKSLDTLFQQGQGVDVNAVDTDGLTPLDIAYKHFHRQPSLYNKIIKKLRQNGARHSSPWRKRKIRSSCPNRYQKNAEDLAKAKGTESNVIVVGEYRYLNDEPIGTGYFSSVFVAIKDEHSDERSDTIYCSSFALKRIEKAKVNPKEITSEVKTLISLPNGCDSIVKYHGTMQDAFFQYICLELMDGDLNELVTNSSEILATKTNLMKAAHDITKGVAYLHKHDFIHGDLKPGNVLYATDPLQFKITDFGLTKNISTMPSNSGSGVAMAPGTRCWMAPELLNVKSRVHTKESDIFSLGLVLHFLFTKGEHPFTTGSDEPAHIIERRIVEMQIHLHKTLHPEGEATSFLQTLLRKDPSKRTPATYLNQHPFLWSERKKIEFLKAVGDQQEAVNPAKHPNSNLDQRLQMTTIGRSVKITPWAYQPFIIDLYRARKREYRTGKVLDFLRFIRNAYAHKQERSPEMQAHLDRNVFLRRYRSLVLDVFDVVQQLGLNESRSNIKQVLSSEL